MLGKTPRDRHDPGSIDACRSANSTLSDAAMRDARCPVGLADD
jgi:hypothetical protein